MLPRASRVDSERPHERRLDCARVGHYGNPLSGMPSYDFVVEVRHPLGELGQRHAIGAGVVGMPRQQVGPSGRRCLGVQVYLDLGKPLVDRDLQANTVGYHRCGLKRASEGAAVDGVQGRSCCERRQPRRRPGGVRARSAEGRRSYAFATRRGGRWPCRTSSRFVAWKLFWAAFVGEDKEVSLNVT